MPAAAESDAPIPITFPEAASQTVPATAESDILVRVAMPEAVPETVFETPLETEAETVRRLSKLSLSQYDRERKDEANRLGIKLSTLDQMVKEERNQDSATSRMPFQDVEPWPEPVDPAGLFNEITATIKRFILIDEYQADSATLWTTHTYLTAEFDISPLGIINAPEKACAKTLFQTVLARMAYRPLPASNASVSAIFRAVEIWGPSLFIDEADTFFKENPELHGVVNAGYKRGGYVLRSESTGDSFEPRMFSVYGAKSIAGISLEKHLPDSTMSRGIVFNMRRKLPHETVERLRQADGAVFDRIASKLARFALDYAQQVRSARPELPEALSDREQDNWEPLLAIAECAGAAWIERATNAALALSKAAESSVSTGNELLADIQAVFDQKHCFKICTADLIKALTEDETNAWAAYNRGKPITPRQLARLLAAYGIHPKTVRMQYGTPKGYDVDQFADAFQRYLKVPEPTTPEKLLQRRNAAPEATSDAADIADAAARAAEIQLAMDAIDPPDRGAVADTFQGGTTDRSSDY